MPLFRQHPTTQFITGQIPFLLPNQQRQSTEGKRTIETAIYILTELPYLEPLHSQLLTAIQLFLHYFCYSRCQAVVDKQKLAGI